MRPLPFLRRAHVRIAWVAGVPLLFWTLSGLWMVSRPIEEVRGTALRAEPARLAPPRGGELRPLAIGMADGRPVWVATPADGGATPALAARRSGLLAPTGGRR